VAEYPWSERVEVHGSEGSLIIDQLLEPPAVIYRGETDLRGTPLATVPYNMAGWKAESIALAVRDFVDAALDGRPAGVDLTDAVYVQRVIDCSYRSAEAGGTRIPVDDEGLPRRAA
jgi:predicted dehydrogenase